MLSWQCMYLFPVRSSEKRIPCQILSGKDHTGTVEFHEFVHLLTAGALVQWRCGSGFV